MGSRARTPAPASNGMEIKYGAPTGTPTQYATPTRTNPYLTSSQYSDMQQHTPSGYYYQGGKFYEPYTVGTKQVQTSSGNSYSPFGGGYGAFNNNQAGGYGGGYNAFGGYRQPTYATVPDILAGSVQSGDQYFKPFAGNAQGIINGELSMIPITQQQRNYQPQDMANLFPALTLLSSQPNSSGAGRFSGLMGSPITTNTQGK